MKSDALPAMWVTPKWRFARRQMLHTKFPAVLEPQICAGFMHMVGYDPDARLF